MELQPFDTTEPVQQSLAAALAAGRMPHAVILEGGTAQARRALAETLAAALLCEDPAHAPCGRCRHCRKSAAQAHPDLLFYTAEDRVGAFKVDTVRALRAQAYVLPNEADRKVFLLENAQAMGLPGQNALLKVLEEPPAFVNFILLCPSAAALLETVRSRAATYTLGAESPEADPALREAALQAALAVAAAVAAPGEFDALKAAAVFEKDAKLLRAALPLLQAVFGAALREKYHAAPPEPEFGEVPALLASRLSRRVLLLLTDRVQQLAEAQAANANHTLTVTRLCTLLRGAVTA